MKPALLSLIAMLFALQLSAQSRYALLIGIGSYPADTQWSVINGDKDIELLKPIIEKCGFEKQNIQTLINEQATKKAIVSAFTDIESKAEKGDIVYIHFSGHGQQITDLNGDETKEWDESIIPYDAAYEYSHSYRGENHIVDDQLNVMLSNVREKVGQSGTLLVTLDACHSGDGTREEDADDQVPTRGAKGKFIIPKGDAVIDQYDSTEVAWVAIGACKSYQNNYEYQVDGKYIGRLSYALSQSLESQIGVLELVSRLQAAYGAMPQPRNIPQTLDIDVPEIIENKRLF